MANVYAPWGFRNSDLLAAKAPNYAFKDLPIAAGYASSIAYGDPVVLGGSGTVQLYSGGGGSILGIFIGCKLPTSQGLNLPWVMSYPGGYQPPSGTYVLARVCIDPDAQYEVQVQGGPITENQVGLFADVVSGSTGKPTLAGLSQAALSANAQPASNLYPFQITGIVQPPALTYLYNANAANNVVKVKISPAQM